MALSTGHLYLKIINVILIQKEISQCMLSYLSGNCATDKKGDMNCSQQRALL